MSFCGPVVLQGGVAEPSAAPDRGRLVLSRGVKVWEAAPAGELCRSPVGDVAMRNLHLSEPVDVKVAAFRVIDFSYVLVLDTDGNLWREFVSGTVPPPRVQVDANVVAVEPLADSNDPNLFVLDRDGNLWRE